MSAITPAANCDYKAAVPLLSVVSLDLLFRKLLIINSTCLRVYALCCLYRNPENVCLAHRYSVTWTVFVQCVESCTAIAACNSLYQPNWFNMQNYGIQPWNNNLHLLLGTDAAVWTHQHVMSYWARYITRGKIALTPMEIQEAWYLAARDAYAEGGYNYTNAMTFAVTGDAACQHDTLQTNSVPTGTPFYSSVQVWP